VVSSPITTYKKAIFLYIILFDWSLLAVISTEESGGLTDNYPI